jgi:hypothetical protein
LTDNYQWYKKDCHTGNTVLYVEKNGGSLMIGGWTMGAFFDTNTHVIDLTGTEHKWADIPLAFDSMSEEFLQFSAPRYAGWLSLPFPDYKTPNNIRTYEQWHGIATTIKKILKQKHDVLVACHGGHGRSGLFCAIVGYILGINSDRSWSSPVEKIRKLHCQAAVETLAQEQFVYDILGLNIKVQTVVKIPKTTTHKACPICGTVSFFVNSIGMCLDCEKKFKNVPKRHDLTLKDIEKKGAIKHECDDDKCMGIWTADVCGHTVHNKIIYEGLCEECWERSYANSLDEPTEYTGKCVICENDHSWYANEYGVCYECSQKIVDSDTIDFVHNTITDPYRAVAHHCDDVGCVGVVVADICGHVLHNQEVEHGLCPHCIKEKDGGRNDEV